INNVIRDVEVGDIYTGKVVKIVPFGAFVELFNGKEGLLHISNISHERIEKVEDVLSIGDEVLVKVIEVDGQGRINLSRKAVLPKETNTDRKVKHNKNNNK
ncbi:MAG: S1 RNA-binding domain-containing protein, partial [Tissierellales bacterium]